VIVSDNEENGVLALKIVFELYKSYSKILAAPNTNYSVDLLDLVTRIISNMEQQTAIQFKDLVAASSLTLTTTTPSVAATTVAVAPSVAAGTDASATTTTAAAAVAGATATPPTTAAAAAAAVAVPSGPKVLTKTMESFRVISECPLLIMMIFQCNQPLIEPALTKVNNANKPTTPTLTLTTNH
jgi:transformation/transcription domain-associated protein